MMTFVKALENNDLEVIKTIRKSDLHNHSTRGGNIRHFVPELIKSLPKLPTKFKDLNHMQAWYVEEIREYFQGREGFERRVYSAFLHAKEDGIAKLCMSFGPEEAVYYENNEAFVNAIKHLHTTTAEDIEFIPELAFFRTQDIKKAQYDFESLLEFDYFKSIDLFGNDSLSVEPFKNIYKIAERHQFIKKAHVGEFGDAKSIRTAVDVLELNQVQHGIAAADSKDVMKYLEHNKIQLNICPTSNVLLSRVNHYRDHPIKALYHAGVPVTINSDDMLIFDQSVSEDYLHLYKHGVLSADELEDVRRTGLR